MPAAQYSSADTKLTNYYLYTNTRSSDHGNEFRKEMKILHSNNIGTNSLCSSKRTPR